MIEKGGAAAGNVTSTGGPNVGGPSITAADKPIAPGASPNRMVGLLGQTDPFMQWQFRRQSVTIPAIIVLQLFIAVTMVFGYSYIIGDTGRQENLYPLTADPTPSILTLGSALTTQAVGVYRTEGSFDWMLVLPLDRLVFVLDDLLVWGLVALPGLMIGAGMGAFCLDIDLSITWWAVPGAMLASLIAASVGYTAAVLFKAQVAMLVSQLCTFTSMIFAPITFPVERLPQWFQTAYQWLPFKSMAQITWGGIASEDFSVPGCSRVVLAAWGVVGLSVVTTALRHRK